MKIPPRASKMLTFDDDDEDEEDFSEEEEEDGDNIDPSSESVLGLQNLLPSSSTANNRNDVRSVKRKLSKISTDKSFQKPSKRSKDNLSSLEDNGSGSKEETMLLKRLVLMIDDYGKDLYQVCKNTNSLVVLLEKVDKKQDLLYENQKKMQRALAKKKVNICHENLFISNKNVYVSKIHVALDGDEFGNENVLPEDSPFKSTLVRYI